MTGYTVHTGSTVKFADGWDQIFGRKGPSTKKSAGTTAEPVSTHVHSLAESRQKTSKKKPSGKKRAGTKGSAGKRTPAAKTSRGKKKKAHRGK